MSVFRNSVNQWCYGMPRCEALPNIIDIGGVPCHYSDNTEVASFRKGGVQVVVIGCCVDVVGEHGGVEGLCELPFDEFIVAIEELLGFYVIFRVDGDGTRIFGDASHLLGIYYGVSGSAKGRAASCEALIVDNPTDYSEVSLDVVRGAYSSGLYLAGDITMFDSVKCLLPNHYLDVATGTAVRYFPRQALVPAGDDEVNQIIDSTLDMVVRGIGLLSKKFKFAAPLTPGGDSRVNCALLRNVLPDEDVLYYVIHNIELQCDPDNVKFIRELAERFGMDDFQILPEESILDESQLDELRKECGDIRGWGRKIWCYHSRLKGRAIVKGELIDQIGKSPYGRGMPEWMASKFFLKTILSNTSKFADIEFTKWYSNAKRNSKGYSMFDLYSWEIRCGRWNSNTTSVSNILGVQNVNFFNCTSILSAMCRIPRKLRVRKCVHRRIMEIMRPDMVDIPVNPYAYRHSKHLAPALSKITPYWCRWIAQYVMQKMRRECLKR